MSFKTVTEKKLTFLGLPVVGPYASRADAPIVMILGLNWNCHPRELLAVTDLSKVHDSWFTPNDKGSMALIAYGKHPDSTKSTLVPLYSCCKYEGDPNSSDPELRGPHYWFNSPDNLYD